MKLGTEDKKKTLLALGLTAVALGTVYVQFFSEAPSPSPSRAVTATRPASALPAQPRSPRQVAAPRQSPPAAGAAPSGPATPSSPSGAARMRTEAFNPLDEDPTLETSRLIAVREVGFSGVERNIFRFGEAKRVVAPPPDSTIAEAQRRQQEFAARAQTQAPQATPAPEQPRKAPRLTWKYYGYANPSGTGERRAFLLDGADVLIGSEGAILKNRYKLVRVGLTNVVIEDMEFQEEQSLAIVAPRG